MDSSPRDTDAEASGNYPKSTVPIGLGNAYIKNWFLSYDSMFNQVQTDCCQHF